MATGTKEAKAAPAGGPLQIEFIKEKETKNAVRYEEEGTNGGDNRGKIGTLYVQKSAFGGKIPDKITVTVEWGT